MALASRSIFTYWRNLFITAVTIPFMLVTVVLVSQIAEVSSQAKLDLLQEKARSNLHKAESVLLQFINIAYQAADIVSHSQLDTSQYSGLLPRLEALRTRFNVIDSIILLAPNSKPQPLLTSTTNLKQLIHHLNPINPINPEKASLLTVEQQTFILINVAADLHSDATKGDNAQLLIIIPLQALVDHLVVAEGEHVSIVNEGVLTRSSIQPPTDDEWQHVSLPLGELGPSINIVYSLHMAESAVPLNTALSSVLVLMIAILIPSIIIAVLMSSKIVKPLRSLNYLVKQYANGVFDAHIQPTQFNELNDLTRFLLDMARKVEKANLTLQQRVKTRTHELEQANTELRTALETLSEMQQHAIESEKMSSLGRLVAGIAHEINTPLGVAVTASTSLERFVNQLATKFKENSLTRSYMQRHMQDTSESCTILIANLQRAAEMIHNFKEVAVDQSSEGLRDFNLAFYVEEVLMTVKPKFVGYNLTCTQSIDENIDIHGYPGAIAQIITNLVENSLLHGFERNKQHSIQLNATLNKQQSIVLTYRDNGKGLSDQVRENIFEPFFTTTRSEGGSGLGMHIVFNLVTQKLKGSIVIGKPEEGVEFIMTFPTQQD
ncbi:HAMP domain-containing sensor histidine kinase [Aliiglaciecola sp. LCG003]|uniref:sensor histidine kinase n=1 Tax=Aliiglaciecola sp. LCG003 TaxID=3053655 RepID=UPI0025739047|nr:HAMP domain-containing sensor histidine kinase [Aliiglaciecola sp. LCG003]WJG08702.1 HAMP domain-containing sensor histidine kinase [Aliiglaciecola sp. LCG003]